MSSSGQKFMSACLGEEGSKALRKAAEKEPKLDQILLPRAILGWLSFTTEHEYEGEIPGLENSYVQFSKSEQGYSGSVTLNDGVYTFSNASIYHLASAIAMSLGVETKPLDTDVRDTVLMRLGKSIDTLTKAQVLVNELKTSNGFEKKSLDHSSGIQFSHEHHDLGDGEALTHVKAIHPTAGVVGEAVLEHKPGVPTLRPADIQVHPEHRRLGIASAMYQHAEKLTGKKVAPSTAQTQEGQALWAGNAQNPQFGKVELPGQSQKPQAQQGPEGPIAPTKQPAGAKKTKIPSLRIGKSEAERECEVCGGHQFKDNRFTGCICYKDLSKSIKTTAYGDGYVLDFNQSIDAEAVKALMKTFRSE